METLFFKRSMAANSIVSRRIWPKFELIQVLMHVIVTLKYQKDRSESTEKRRRRHLSNYKSTCMGAFLDAKGKFTRRSNLAEIRTHPRYYAFSCYMQDLKGTKRKRIHRFFRRSWAAHSVVSGGMWPIFELIRVLVHIFATCIKRVA